MLGAYAGLNIDLAGGREAGAGFKVGTAFGTTLGVMSGVWLGGYAMGGDGSLGWTLLASALGAGVSTGLLAIDDKPGTLAAAAAVPVASAIVAYELSSHLRRAKPSAEKPAPVTLVPTVGVGYLGVAGAF